MYGICSTRTFLVPVTEIQRVYSEGSLKQLCKENRLLFNKIIIEKNWFFLFILALKRILWYKWNQKDVLHRLEEDLFLQRNPSMLKCSLGHHVLQEIWWPQLLQSKKVNPCTACNFFSCMWTFCIRKGFCNWRVEVSSQLFVLFWFCWNFFPLYTSWG